MESRRLELAVGIFIAIGFAAMFMLAIKTSNLSGFSVSNGYTLTARFDNVGSLKTRAPVTVAGVEIGRVTGIALDQKTYEAVVTMNIDGRYRLPTDSSASILTSGLLGEQYIGVQPGAEEAYLKGGGEVKYTQSAVVLERLISQFLFNKAASPGKQGAGAGAGGAP